MRLLLFSTCLLIPFLAFNQVILDDLEEGTYLGEIADEDYTPWWKYSKAGFWVVPLATPIPYSPYDHLPYAEVSGSGRRGANLSEWAYVNKKGANVNIISPDRLQVMSNPSGLFGLRSKKKKGYIIPPQYQQLEYVTRNLLTGWTGDSLDIWNTKGEFIKRIKYPSPPRFTVNLPAIQKGGNELDLSGIALFRGETLLGPYSRDEPFLAPRQLQYIDRLLTNSNYIALYKIENNATLSYRSPKRIQQDSSLTDSLFLMLIQMGKDYQLLASQGQDIFRQLPFTFPTKGKATGTFKGRHMGRVGPLYPAIYYDYSPAKLTIEDNRITVQLRFTERNTNSKEKRIFTYQLSGYRSDYNEKMLRVSNPYRNPGRRTLYQYQQGETAALLDNYTYTLIPAGKYQQFMEAKGRTVLAQTIDGEIKYLLRNGSEITKAQFMQMNKLTPSPYIQQVNAGASRGGILFRDSLAFVGPFLPTYSIVYLGRNKTIPVFTNRNENHSILFDTLQNRITDTIAGVLQRPEFFQMNYIPFTSDEKKGMYDGNFQQLIPPLYDELSINRQYEKDSIFFNFRQGLKRGILNLKGEIVAGPVDGYYPIKVNRWMDLYLQKGKDQNRLFNKKWQLVTDQVIDDFPISWYKLYKHVQAFPIRSKGKVGIMKLNGEMLIPTIHDTLYFDLSYKNNFIAIGKPGKLQLIDVINLYIYPKTYQNIHSYYRYRNKKGWDNSLHYRAKKQFGAPITVILETLDSEIEVLLEDGKIIKLEDIK